MDVIGPCPGRLLVQYRLELLDLPADCISAHSQPVDRIVVSPNFCLLDRSDCHNRLSRATHAVDQHAAGETTVGFLTEEQLHDFCLDGAVAVAVEVEAGQLLGERGVLLLLLRPCSILMPDEILVARTLDHGLQERITFVA